MVINQGTKQTIESLLVQKGLLSEEQLEKAKNIQTQTLERLENIIIRLGFLSEKQILDLWAEFLGISVVDLTNIKVDAKILSMIPEYQAKQYKMIPFKKDGNKLTVVMTDPFDIMATAGRANRAVVKEFKGIEAGESLALELVPKSTDPQANQAPIINFIEVIREGAGTVAAASSKNVRW